CRADAPPVDQARHFHHTIGRQVVNHAAIPDVGVNPPDRTRLQAVDDVCGVLVGLGVEVTGDQPGRLRPVITRVQGRPELGVLLFMPLAPAEVFINRQYVPRYQLGPVLPEIGQAEVMVQGKPRQAWMFWARLGYSTDIFVRLYPHSRTEAFLDGLRRAFEHFGGVPAEVVLDNTRTAVKCFVGITGREETPAFLAFRTYYVFRSRFCNPRQANGAASWSPCPKYLPPSREDLKS